eukprot:Lankesteria_metandrocarpae@DN5095_c0_g1_i1.p2
MDESCVIHFGKGNKVDNAHVVWTTPLSYCICNLRPLVPYHLLVCPIRIVERYNDLTEDECLDLWKCGAKACKLLKRITNGKFDSVVQDGVTAGQNVMHVHLHVLSTTGEAKYDVSPSERRDRTFEEMAAEVRYMQEFL